MATQQFHTYCPMCVAQCGVVAIVEDGRFTKVRPELRASQRRHLHQGIGRAGNGLRAGSAEISDKADAPQGGRGPRMGGDFLGRGARYGCVAAITNQNGVRVPNR